MLAGVVGSAAAGAVCRYICDGAGILLLFQSYKAVRCSNGVTFSAFFLKPAIAPVMAVIFLGETILWNTYIGIGLILLASYMNIKYQKKDEEIRKRFEKG